jgi:hypothetical protein
MAFIKVDNIVINTDYIAAIKLESKTYSGDSSISILMATPKFPLVELEEAALPNPYHYEWIDFTGKKAKVLRDYFTSLNSVIDLMPQSS